MTAKKRVFADSNVTYSASLSSENDFEAIWRIPDVDVLTSLYSIEEVSRNLKNAEQRARLWKLVYISHLVPDGGNVILDPKIILPLKDIPILRSAIAGDADYLVTGDGRHFGRYEGRVIQGVLIERPANFRMRYPKYFRETIKK